MDKKLFALVVSVISLMMLLFLALIAFAFFPTTAHANGRDVQDTAIGVGLGMLSHEANHKFLAKGEIDFHGPISNPKWEYGGDKKTYIMSTKDGKPYMAFNTPYGLDRYNMELERVAEGGMLGENMMSHWAMNQNVTNRRLRNVRNGFVAFNIVNNVAYLTKSKNEGDLQPGNFRSEKHRSTYKRILWVDTTLLAFEFFTKESLLPKDTEISFHDKTVMLKKTWKFWTSREKRDKKQGETK